MAERQATEYLGRAIRAENRAHIAELRIGRLEQGMKDIKVEPARAVEIADAALVAGGVILDGEVAA